LALHSVWKADTPVARAMLGATEGYATYVETFILVKTPGGWKTANLPIEDLKSFWGALGCACWAV
jgi:hypothetical protein